MDYGARIEFWFRHYRGGSLLLPDGWYGRPMDNQHQLTSLSTSGDCMVVGLDNFVRLTFHGLGGVQLKGSELVIGPARRICVETAEPGSRVAHSEAEYRDAVVRIVSARDASSEASEPWS